MTLVGHSCRKAIKINNITNTNYMNVVGHSCRKSVKTMKENLLDILMIFLHGKHCSLADQYVVVVLLSLPYIQVTTVFSWWLSWSMPTMLALDIRLQVTLLRPGKCMPITEHDLNILFCTLDCKVVLFKRRQCSVLISDLLLPVFLSALKPHYLPLI